jgi:hypothetical protein
MLRHANPKRGFCIWHGFAATGTMATGDKKSLKSGAAANEAEGTGSQQDYRKRHMQEEDRDKGCCGADHR